MTDGTIPVLDHQRMIQAQAITIQSLQQRIWRLEMEIVDLMSASMANQMETPPPGSVPSAPEEPAE